MTLNISTQYFSVLLIWSGDSHIADKLQTERDSAMEQLHGIMIESCSAYYDGYTVRIIGEVVSTDPSIIPEYREVQVMLYDAEGEILARDFTNWSVFQTRQSFEIEIDDLPATPSKVKVFPS